jgi:hypothetical protein
MPRILLCILISMYSDSIYGSLYTVDEKLEVVKKVYEKVYAATGNPALKPAIILDSYQKTKIAYITKDKSGRPFIGFEESAFDVCADLGPRRDDAIAYILGHELSHHLLQHSWGEEFGSAFSISALTSQIKEWDKISYKKFEAQADERGGILCYMAGFNVRDLSETLLRNLYATYRLQDNPKYPTLNERIKIASEQDSIIETYIKVFEVGNYAMMLADYSLAIQCYEYIVYHSFHSREIYNNLGVAYFNIGMNKNKNETIGFYYPICIDLEGKLAMAQRIKISNTNNPFITKGNENGPGDGNPESSTNNELKELNTFLKAVEMFKNAIQFDEDYAVAYLNIASCYTLMHWFDDAEANLKMVKVKNSAEFNRTLHENYIIVSCIHDVLNLLHKKGKDEFEDEIEIVELKAKRSLEKLNTLASEKVDYAVLNLDIIEGRSKYVYEKFSVVINAMEDKHQLNKAVKNLPAKKINLNSTQDLEIFSKKGEFIYSINNKSGVIYYFKTVETGSVKSGNLILDIGIPFNTLKVKIGEPSQVLTTVQGTVYFYPALQVFILTNADKVVTRIICYSVIA